MSTYLLNLRNRHLFLLDIFVLLLTPLLATMLRLDTPLLPGQFYPGLLAYTAIALMIRLAIFYRFGLYSRFWAFASVDDMLRIATAVSASTIVLILLTSLLLILRPFPFARSVLLIDALLVLLLVGGNRFAIRLGRRRRPGPRQETRRLLIYGAGEVGSLLVHEMLNMPHLGFEPIAFLDDDRQKHNMTIHGLPVLGGRQALAPAVAEHHIDTVIIAIPSSSGKEIRAIAAACDRIPVDTKVMPGLSEILNGRVGVSQLRDLAIEDLLRRSPVRTDIAAVHQALAGQRVLVTGGGGSIGSELCRQILYCMPRELIILGHGENSVFELCQELGGSLGTVSKITPVIADIRFPDRLHSLFKSYRPEVVFHAAAHKHVPLMEANPAEAITNNVLGTRYLLEASLAAGVERFVMISTDKAVNPTSVMGASKRVAELLVLDAASRSGRPYVAVRFGNVLGSRGSVVLTFQKQIAQGGPLTVTSPEVTRYFMTPSEAVQLVLQAATLGEGGEVFVLDMGEPVRIVDLARDMIRLSGRRPEKDIAIEYIGLLPGEKLFEDLFAFGEHYQATRHEKILIASNSSNLVPEGLDIRVEALLAAAAAGDRPAISRALHQLLPEYQGAGLETLVASRRRQRAGTSYQAPAGVVHREIDDTAIILNGETGQFFTLNEVGTQMWAQLIVERRPFDKVVDAIVADYDVPPERAELDLTHLLTRLENHGLAEPI